VFPGREPGRDKLSFAEVKAQTGRCRTAKLLDDLGAAFGLGARDIVAHRLQLLGQMAGSACGLAGGAQRILAAIGGGHVTGKFLIGELGSSSNGPVGSTM
jgi:hypothetical protein